MMFRLLPLISLMLLLDFPSFVPVKEQQPDRPAADATRAADSLAVFRAWLDRVHKGYRCDEGPGWFRNATVDSAYPGQRFCYVLTHARGIQPQFSNALSLVAHIREDGSVAPLNRDAPPTFQPGLIRVGSAKEARRAAAAVLILALGDPAQRRWRIDENWMRVRRAFGGTWICNYAHGDEYHVSEVDFDTHGMLTGIHEHTPPVP